jgi:predicted nucleic acid-binding protein
MPVVIDTSALLPALVDPGSAGRAARDAMRAADLVAPPLIDAETLQVLRSRVRQGSLPLHLAEEAILDLQAMPLERVDVTPLLNRVWQLRENLTAYDATFVAVAEAFDAVLVTADERMTKAPGPRCHFKVVQPG